MNSCFKSMKFYELACVFQLQQLYVLNYLESSSFTYFISVVLYTGREVQKFFSL